MDATVILFRTVLHTFYHIIHAINSRAKKLTSAKNISSKHKLPTANQKKFRFVLIAEHLLTDYLASSSNVVSLCRWFYSTAHLDFWVSIENNNRRNVNDELKMWLTVFIRNALIRCCMPLAVILFEVRSRVVSVYSERWSQKCDQ